jgi:Ca-activated chloride channel family protein
MSVMPALASSSPASHGCRLVAVDGRLLPLRAVEVTADARGGLARVRLRQTFANPYEEPLAATYQLPLPDDGAVVDFAFVLQGRRISGRVEKRAEARAAFEQAVLEGRTAALLEQDRSSLFTQELGNLPPGAELHVEIEVEQLLMWRDGGWEWRWPTVVGPRYLGAPGETPDAARIEVAVADAPLPVRCTASITVGDAMTGAISSPSHALEQGGSAVGLSGSLDRDVVVRWPVAAAQPGMAVEVARPVGDGEAYGWLTLIPPAAHGAVVPRDLCLLLDTSGSMSGTPLAQLVALSKALVCGLRAGDRLEMIEFSSSPRRWRKDAVAIDERTRAEAVAWLDALRAGGGTAMHEAVSEALRPLRPEAQRQVVLVTDGYIGFEAEVIGRIVKGLPRGSRIHTVGIGSAVNRTLTRGVARAGGGHEAIVGPDEAVSSVTAELLARTGDPLWVDVTVSGTAVREVAPKAIPDLLAGRPSRVALRLAPEGGSVILTALGPQGPVTHEQHLAPLAMGSGRRVLATRFAREAVDDLELALSGGAAQATVDAAIEALGLRHRIATRLTSWVAVTEEATVDPGDPLRKVTIPHELPHGVNAQGVGLRATAAAAPAHHSPPLGSAAAKPPPGYDPSNPQAFRRKQEAPAPSGPIRRGRAESKEEAAKSSEVADKLQDTKKKRKVADVEQERAAGAPKGGLLKRLFGSIFDGPEPEPVETPEMAEEEEYDGPAAPIRLVARVMSHADGKLVLEVQIDQDLDWTTDGLIAFASDGSSFPVGVQPGTTKPRRLSAGQVARLVLPWNAPTPPARIVAGSLEIVVTM